MKKIFDKKIIFNFTLGILLCSGMVYGVNTYKSETIQYNPTDASWGVNNVSDALDDLYSNINKAKIKEQTVTQKITMAAVYKGFYTFTFDELEEVKGVSVITKDYVGDGNSSGKYQHLVPVEGTGVGTADSYTTHYNRGPYYKIDGNTVVVRLYNGVGSYTTTATWSITAVGI